MKQRLSLYELNSMVRDALSMTLPDSYWVEAELSEVREGYGAVMTEVGLPIAITSGLMRPSAVGPTALKGALTPCGLTLPTVIISLASAGKLMRFQVPIPWHGGLPVAGFPAQVCPTDHQTRQVGWQ